MESLTPGTGPLPIAPPASAQPDALREPDGWPDAMFRGWARDAAEHLVRDLTLHPIVRPHLALP